MNLASLTVRPDVRLPSGLRGRTVHTSAVEQLAVRRCDGIGKVFVVQARGQTPRHYMPHAVESFEVVPVKPKPRPKRRYKERLCGHCGKPHKGSGETCSRSCAAYLRHQRARKS